MRQYYRALVKKQNGRLDAYNRYVIRNGERDYTPAKLTEHSWWLNDFVNAVCLDVYKRKKKNRIAWLGDYADTFLKSRGLKMFNGLNNRQIKSLSKRCWDCEGIDVPFTEFTLDGLYLINHTKQEYIFTNSDLYWKRIRRRRLSRPYRRFFQRIRRILGLGRNRYRGQA